jgi:hypothetical protein
VGYPPYDVGAGYGDERNKPAKDVATNDPNPWLQYIIGPEPAGSVYAIPALTICGFENPSFFKNPGVSLPALMLVNCVVK